MSKEAAPVATCNEPVNTFILDAIALKFFSAPNPSVALSKSSIRDFRVCMFFWASMNWGLPKSRVLISVFSLDNSFSRSPRFLTTLSVPCEVIFIPIAISLAILAGRYYLYYAEFPYLINICVPNRF